MSQVYIVQGTLKCDGVTYPPGSEFTSDDPERIKELRQAGALALPAETQTAEQITAQGAAQQARIAELEAQLAQAQARLQQAEQEAEQGTTADGDKSVDEGAEAASESQQG